MIIPSEEVLTSYLFSNIFNISFPQISDGGHKLPVLFEQAEDLPIMLYAKDQAKGIDTYAHTAALKEDGGRTVAVLGSGVDLCYPKEHCGLYQRILKQGMVVM